MADVVAVDVVRCGAKTRRGSACAQRAGARTTHAGQGRCWMHGGTKPGDPRVKHGRYRTIKSERLRELIAQHEADPDPLNILPEIAALRALFQEFIERYDVHTAALLAWHASFQLQQRPIPEELAISFERVVDEWEIALREEHEPTEAQKTDLAQARQYLVTVRESGAAVKPKTVLDLTDAYRVLGEVGRMVERVEKARSANAISRPEMNRVIHAMARVVDTVLPHDEAHEVLRKQIREGWLAIAV